MAGTSIMTISEMSSLRLALVMAAMKVITTSPLMWDIGQDAIRSYTVYSTVNSINNLTEDTHQMRKQMEMDVKYYNDLLHAGIATPDHGRDLIRNLESQKQDLKIQQENLKLVSNSLSEGEDIHGTLVFNSATLFGLAVELSRLLLALGFAWRRHPTFLACLIAFGPLVQVVDSGKEMRWELHWGRGEHLIPAQLTEMQELIMNFTFQATGTISILPIELTLLPLENMTFNDWLLADTMVCILNVVFVVCCCQAATREQNNNESKLKSTLRNVAKVKSAAKEDSEAAFLQACLEGLTDSARRILKNPDFNINCLADLTSDTGLHLACRGKHAPIVQMILDKARKSKKGMWCLNAKNADNHTPLMIAAATSSRDIVIKLLKTNRIELGEDLGAIPVATAIKNNNLEVAEIIYSKMKEKKIKLKELSIEVFIERIFSLSKELASKSLSDAKQKDHKSTLRFFREKVIDSILGHPGDSDPRRKAESPEDMLKRTLTELQEMCECLVCNESFATRGIFACENDHWLCGDCKVKNTDMLRNRCPLCNIDFNVAPPRRCITGEKLARLVNQLPPVNNDN